ncbi:MmcQ/YjbR family DNA-binding protein [Cognatiyoonia sp. IB215446]|uniref:MmcQ/YjbR family DNA-binding protein n=1 Tax=Cognatiyoonia sp. IB215446 TaxID=3097355 RepID=UPI002A1494A1|nr:MmcQ/YjbR family DNA-binding protein [Cognatiyoonia sp. IB215446]MDX8348772.1 MmcQ/YjbR family DNA-binding protein [Cognatiyoonia sp. IB215446]
MTTTYARAEIMIVSPRDLRHPRHMSRKKIDHICSEMPGAVASDPTTELDSWKVGGKMFVCFGERIDGFAAKTDSVDIAQMLIDAGAATKAPYFHKSWVLVSFDAAEDEMRHRIQTSYDIIFKALTKKAQAEISAA